MKALLLSATALVLGLALTGTSRADGSGHHGGSWGHGRVQLSLGYVAPGPRYYVPDYSYVAPGPVPYAPAYPYATPTYSPGVSVYFSGHGPSFRGLGHHGGSSHHGGHH